MYLMVEETFIVCSWQWISHNGYTDFVTLQPHLPVLTDGLQLKIHHQHTVYTTVRYDGENRKRQTRKEAI